MPPDSWAGRACSNPASPKRSSHGAADAPRPEREAGVVQRGAPRQQQVALGHERGGGGVDATGIRPLEAADELQQRRLSAPTWPDDGDDLVMGGAERHRVQDNGLSKLATHDLDRHAVRLVKVARLLYGSLDHGLAPSAGITPQVRRVSAGWCLGRYLSRLSRQPPWVVKYSKRMLPMSSAVAVGCHPWGAGLDAA
jgi:hypothetical protein